MLFTMLPVEKVDYFEMVSDFFSGCWRVLSDIVLNISTLPRLLSSAFDWTSQALSVCPSEFVSVVSFAIGGVLLFRVIRM